MCGPAASAFVAEQAADCADGFVDDFADRRFRADDAVDDAFGDAGDAAAPQRPAERRFVDLRDRVVDGFGDLAGGRRGATAATAGRVAVPPPPPPELEEPVLPLGLDELGFGAAPGLPSWPPAPPVSVAWTAAGRGGATARGGERAGFAGRVFTCPLTFRRRPASLGSSPVSGARRSPGRSSGAARRLRAGDRAASSPAPPSAAIGQSLKTWAETSTAKTTMARAINVAPPIAPTK